MKKVIVIGHMGAGKLAELEALGFAVNQSEVMGIDELSSEMIYQEYKSLKDNIVLEERKNQGFESLSIEEKSFPLSRIICSKDKYQEFIKPQSKFHK